jgi:hypothetical protein
MNDTNRAVALLRQTLPEHVRRTPFLVQTYTEALDGIAFCEQHPSGPVWKHAACLACEVIETPSEQLAALIVALLRATAPLAAHLNAIDAWDHRPEQDNPDGPWRCGACGDLGRQPIRCPAWSAADITRAINGTEAANHG